MPSLSALLLPLLLAAAAPPPPPGAAAVVFDRLRVLVGDWEGTAVWSGARSDSYPLTMRYSLTGNDSALVEDMISAGKTVMTTVYHLDGADLRATHYCGTHNQPRLRAAHLDPGSGHVELAFVDITNLPSPAAPHVDGLELLLPDQDHLTVTFHFTAGGKDSRERIELHRVAARAGVG